MMELDKLYLDLGDPFNPEDLEWRVQMTGQGNSGPWALVVPYITARAIMSRLDEVVGPLNWKDEYSIWKGTANMCGLSIWDKTHSQWVTKFDGAEDTDIEKIKGGISNSFRRAAVKWNIGRYLYGLDQCYANIKPNGKFFGQNKDKTKFKYDPPDLPTWALPHLTKEQLKTVKAEIKKYNLTEEKLCDTLRIKDIAEVPKDRFEGTMNWIQKTGTVKKKEGPKDG